MRKAFIFIGLPLAFAGGNAFAQLPMAGPADAVAGVEACRSAIGPAGADENRLTSAGWTAATASQNGKSIVLPIRFFGKNGTNALITVVPGDGTPLCVITARLARASTFDGVAGALDQALMTSRKGEKNEPTTAYWFPQGHLVQLQLTGKPDTPSLRIAVMHRAQEKK